MNDKICSETYSRLIADSPTCQQPAYLDMGQIATSIFIFARIEIEIVNFRKIAPKIEIGFFHFFWVGSILTRSVFQFFSVLSRISVFHVFFPKFRENTEKN